MARKPNYNFERSEREKAKAAKLAEKAKAKNEKKASAPDPGDSSEPLAAETLGVGKDS